MENFILLGYEFLTVVLPAVILAGIFHLIYRRQNMSVSHRYFLYIILFSFYLFGVFHFAGVGTIFDTKRFGIRLNPDQINLIPFTDNDIDFIAYGLNVIFFIPLGFLLPFIWPDFHKYIKILLSGISLSALIEASQLLNNRRTDIDDLILNTVGALLGMSLFKLVSSVTKHESAPADYYKGEITAYVLVTFLFRFFTYDEFGMAKKLFGF